MQVDVWRIAARGRLRKRRRGIGGGRILEGEYAPERAWHVQYGDEKAGDERAEEAQRSRCTCVTYHADGGGGTTTQHDAVGGGGDEGGSSGRGRGVATTGGGPAPVWDGVINVLFRHFSRE